MEGFIIPLCILAMLGLRIVLITRLKTLKSQQRLKSQVLFWSSLASFFFILMILYRGAIFERTPLFMERPKVDALLWLGQNSEDETVMFGAFQTSTDTLALANMRLFTGHSVETAFNEQKEELIASFYCDELLPEERHILYQKYRIEYVFYGAEEREFTEETITNPAWATELELIYDQADYQIYAVPAELREKANFTALSIPANRTLNCGSVDGLELIYSG